MVTKRKFQYKIKVSAIKEHFTVPKEIRRVLMFLGLSEVFSGICPPDLKAHAARAGSDVVPLKEIKPCEEFGTGFYDYNAERYPQVEEFRTDIPLCTDVLF